MAGRIAGLLRNQFRASDNAAPQGALLSRPARVYILSVCAIGLCIVLQPPTLPVPDLYGLVAFLILGGIGQLITIRFYKNASVSLAMAAALAAILVFGPVYAVWVNLASGLVHYFAQIRPKKRPLYRSAVTTATLVITAWISGWVYIAFGGQFGPESDYSASLIAIFLASLTYYGINTTLITAAMALEQRQRFLALLRTNYQWLTVNVASVSPLAIGIALLYQKIGLAGLAVYLLPIIMARYSFQLYARTMEDVHRTNEELKEANERVRRTNEELSHASEHIHQSNEELRKANERLNIMHEVSRSLVGSLHLDDTLHRMLTATQIMGFPASFVAGPLTESESRILHWNSANPEYARWLGADPAEPVQNQIWKIIASATQDPWYRAGEPRVQSTADYLPVNEAHGDAGVAADAPSMLTLIPLFVGDEPWGIVGVGSLDAPSAMEMKELLIFRSMAKSALEMALAHERAQRDALMDNMTGLFNHRYFQEALQRELQDAAQRDSFLSLLMLDINKFKEFNDVYGHLVGDQVLQAVGELLRGNVREDDIACRYGGDEFCILLPRTDRARAMEVASRIDRAVREYPFQVRQDASAIDAEDRPLDLTVSIGVASFPEAAQTRAGLVGQADRACYRAKALGGGVVAEVGAGAADERANRTNHAVRLQLVKRS